VERNEAIRGNYSEEEEEGNRADQPILVSSASTFHNHRDLVNPEESANTHNN
jgi:hypothetical protein